MQRVQKKQHREIRHRRGLWLAACALVLAGTVAAAVLLKRPEEPMPVKEDHSGFLTNRAAEEIAEVEVERRNGETWAAERAEDGTLRMKDGGWALDESLGEMILDALAHLEYEDILTENKGDYADDPAAFGLDRPRVTAACRFTGGGRLEVRLGDEVAGGEGALYYMAVAGDDRLYAASAGTLRDLDTEKALLHPVAQPEIIPALLDRITVAGTDGTAAAEWTLAGAVTDSDAGENWRVTAPFEYPADAETIASLKENAGNLRMGTWYGEATEENLAACGLTKPACTLIFHTAAGSTGTVTESGVYDVVDREEKTTEIAIGSRQGESTAYARFGDEIFTVSMISLSAFTETNPLDTAARYPAAVPLDSLAEVTVEAGGETITYALEHTAAAEAAGGDGTGNNGESGTGDGETGEDAGLRAWKNGEEISGSAFRAAYERLMTVTVSGRLPEGTAIGETTKKYTFRTTSGGTHTLEFWTFDEMHDGLTQDGCTLFYLIRDGMTPLP